MALRFSALWLVGLATLMIFVANGASVSVAEPLNDTAINDTDNYTFTPLDDDGYIIANSSILIPTNYTKWSTIGDTVAMSVYAADVDNDGTIELITGGYTNLGTTAELKVWNYAGGKLSLKNLTTWKGWVYSIYVSDVDNDGTPEIVTAGNNAASPAANAQLRVWNYTNNRLNLESSAEWGPSASIPAGAYSVYAADVDGDGTAEIITAGYSNPDYIWSQLRIWNHTGSALNLEASRDWKKGIHALAFSVYASDVNSDGTVEIITSGVVISPTLAQLVVWNYTFGALNNETSVEWGIGYQTNAYSVYASDADGDGTQEMLTGGYIGGTDGYRRAELKIWNYVSGSLTAELSAQWHLGGKTQVQSVYAVDTGGNGKKDILTLGSFSNGTGYYGQLRVWDWNGSTLFLEKSDDWHEAAPVEPGAAESLKAADLDGDGTAEIIAVGSVGTWPGRRAFVRIYDFAPEHPAEVCGNNICGAGETWRTCPSDCLKVQKNSAWIYWNQLAGYDLNQTLLELQDGGIRTLFLGVDTPQSQSALPHFIRSAHEKGMFVHAMYGSPVYANGIDETGIANEVQHSQNYVDSVKIYNDNRIDPAERLDGVQSDIEIFPSPEDGWNETGYTKMAVNYRRIFNSTAKMGLFFSAALPEYLKNSEASALNKLTAELNATVPMVYIMDSASYQNSTPRFNNFGWIKDGVEKFLNKIHENSIFVTGLSAYDREFSVNSTLDTNGEWINSLSLASKPGSGLNKLADNNAVQDLPFYSGVSYYNIPYLLDRSTQYEPRNFISDYYGSGVWVYRFNEIATGKYVDVQLTSPIGLYNYTLISDNTAAIHPKKDQYFGSAFFSFLQAFEPSSNRKAALQAIRPPEAKLEYNCLGKPSVSLINNGPSDLFIEKLHLSKNVNLTLVPATPATIPKGGKFTAYYAVNDSANGLITFVTNHGPVGAIVAADRLCFTVFSPVDLQVTDPLGRYTGFNRTSGFVLLGIPGVYSGPESDPEYIVVPNPASGQYKIELTSTTEIPANYSLSIVRAINDTIVYQSGVNNATIGPNEIWAMGTVTDIASLQKTFKPTQIHEDRHGRVKTTINVTNIGQVNMTRIGLTDELLPNFTIKNIKTISARLVDREGRKHEIDKKTIGKPTTINGSLRLVIDLSKGKKLHELKPSESLLVKYEMHPVTRGFVIGEYITETIADVTSKEGAAQTLTTASKFSIITKHHDDEEEADDDDHEENED